ncbi:hypothetical protein [Actinoallomurus iriomotensis]|uniref:Uncharacterized protein n=1 Tax=Actinoallomurus iriomotensis TaxID=478107 RepID=A0A9W6VUV1_9ACTN|nr:hypothetical protein [Actinoallomurus iriomotensis]GLY79927.1 hypothetical protein Airi01_081940 [Actinoallomurus iriomotensis]
MRAVRTAAALACATIVAGAGLAAADSITVTPGSPRPGQQVHISVPGCATGSSAHVAVSPAFTTNVTLYGKADTGDADPTIRQELRPGTYPVTAYCGADTVQGTISVAAGTDPSGDHGGGTNNWLLIVVFVVVAGVVAAFVFGRRGRRVS